MQEGLCYLVRKQRTIDARITLYKHKHKIVGCGGIHGAPQNKIHDLDLYSCLLPCNDS